MASCKKLLELDCLIDLETLSFSSIASLSSKIINFSLFVKSLIAEFNSFGFRSKETELNGLSIFFADALMILLSSPFCS